jgi:hypothetical protein
LVLERRCRATALHRKENALDARACQGVSVGANAL